MTREELIKAAINAGVWANEGELEHDLPILEPIIRADEREDTIASLHDRVQALWLYKSHPPDASYVDAIKDVLKLLEGNGQ